MATKVKEVIDKMRKRMRMKGWEKFKKKHDDQEAKEDKGASGQWRPVAKQNSKVRTLPSWALEMKSL